MYCFVVYFWLPSDLLYENILRIGTTLQVVCSQLLRFVVLLVRDNICFATLLVQASYLK